MRILQIVPSISLVYGGPSQMVLGLSSALAKKKVKVTIITTNSNGDNGQKPLDVPLNQIIEQDGYQIIYFNCSPFRRYKFSWDLLTWLNSHANEFDLAHIHALFSPVSSASATVCRWRKLPYILRPLGTLDPADLQKKKRFKQFYAAILERENLAGAAAIHFTSSQEAKISQRFGVSTKDLVIPLGVSIKASSNREESKQHFYTQFDVIRDIPLLLFMSRIDPKKGLDLLLPALEKVATKLNFHFILAGTNPQDPKYEEKIKAQIQASPLLYKRTTITGFVTGELKFTLLQAADLFVLPSYYENFGIAVAEAMVVGTPVVISDQVHICQEIEQSESGWVSRMDMSTLSELIYQALQNPQELKRRGLLAQKYALENYSWDAIAHQMIAAYLNHTAVGEASEFRTSK